MSRRKQVLVMFWLVCSVSLIAAAVSALLTASYESQRQYALFHAVYAKVVQQQPQTRERIAAALKENIGKDAGDAEGSPVLEELGYRRSDFSKAAYRQMLPFALAGMVAGVLLFMAAFLYRNKREAARIQDLAAYLEQADTGRAEVLSSCGEDDFSKLEDEIYKTVTFLYQTKDAAVQAKNDFAQNLSNIAHQIKTPITAISLSVQMMEQESDRRYLKQVKKQLVRLSHLEEALLLLSRIDAGTLCLQQKEADVFTILVLAADHLQQLFAYAGMSVEVLELGEQRVVCDLDWTMEAVMNLMKNCMEHSHSKTVHCSYAQNPLYTQILIWDDGDGFLQEDLPHLFERFYRGKNAAWGGIGIGLALAKEIMERQNATIQAKNRANGGAQFEIRFYSH